MSIKIVYLPKGQLNAYANPTEPNLYPNAFHELVLKEEYDRAIKECARMLEILKIAAEREHPRYPGLLKEVLELRKLLAERPPTKGDLE